MNIQGTDKAWLKSCPAGDCNFKSHLKTATDEDLKELIDELPESGNKTKIAAFRAELKCRNKLKEPRD